MPAQQPDPRQLDDSAWDEVRGLARELAELALASIPPAEFQREFFSRLMLGLGAVGGALWIRDQGRMRVGYQVGFGDSGLVGNEQRQRGHGRLLEQVFTTAQSCAIPPSVATGDNPILGRFENPSQYVLLLSPLCCGPRVEGIIELFLPAELSPNTQENYRQFLARVCQLPETAAASLTVQKPADQSWNAWHVFARAVHSSLDLRETSYAIVNEARRLLTCDRVTLLVGEGRNCRVQAISGQDVFERRSTTVRSLERLTAAVLAVREPLWHADGDDPRQLPPPIESALAAYLDVAQPKLIAVIPLASGIPNPSAAPASPAGSSHRPESLGAWVLERMSSVGDRERLASAAAVAADLATPALANALRYEGLFLMPLWRTLGRGTALLGGRTRYKTLAALTGVLAAMAALALIPADFELEARGILVPVVRREVFAKVDGDVVRVLVRHGDPVREGDLLLELRNSELGVRGAGLEGELHATEEQLKALEQGLLGQKLIETERLRLHSERLQLTEKLAGLRRQLELHQRQSADLRVTSPITGQVVTWDVDERLPQRPVRRGDRLLTLIDPTADWELELRMPEAHIGYVDRAWQDSGGALSLRFASATDPGREVVGQVRRVERLAQVREADGNTVLLRASIDRDDLRDPRYGAEVTARVLCGRRSLGFVWLHDVFAFVHRRILFRL